MAASGEVTCSAPPVGSRIVQLLIVTISVVLVAVGCSTDDPPRVAGPGETETTAGAPGRSRPIHAVLLREQYELPPLREGAGDEAGRLARGTQVHQRAEQLGLDAETAYGAWSRAADTAAANHDTLSALLEQPLPQMEFEGTRLSELGEMLPTAGSAHITVVARTLLVDTSLTISGRDVIVDFAGAVLEPASEPSAWVVEIRSARNVAVVNAEIADGANGILVEGASDVAVEGNELHGLSQNGIVVTGGSHAAIRNNRLHGLSRSGIVLHGDVTESLIEGNEIRDLEGHSNWHAGMLITGRTPDIAADPAEFNPYNVIGERILDRLQNPSHNVIVGNVIRDNLSSGIYNDGGNANVILENTIEGNAKEGICLDNGATANVVAGNTVTANGNRWGQPDEVLDIDDVLEFGRAPDGTAIAKLPGISIDNALYNEVHANVVRGNFGGGIKMVRTSFFNVISNNALTDNDLGRNDRFHFFGIELGAAVQDFSTPDLDFVGSSGNIIVANGIHGSHHSGIFIAVGSVQNEIIDNDIDGVTALDIERPS